MARPRVGPPGSPLKIVLGVLVGLLLLAVPVGYFACLIEVPTNSQVVLVSKVGKDLAPDQEIAPPGPGPLHKGVQAQVLTEGRYFYNPINWDWEIYEQFNVPQGKIGVRVALSGDELPAGEVLAEPGQKGVLRDVLEPGRYPYNKYAELIELHDPIGIPPGFVGVVTNLAGSICQDPKAVLVKEGERGVQPKTLPPATYYLNPYEKRVSLVDLRSQRYDLSDGDPMDFLSADGFPVVIDGNVEFRLVEDRVPEVFVLYNEDVNGDEIKEEIIKKIITPESRSICRISGSKLTGGAFISGTEREGFEKALREQLKENCEVQGVEIVSVAISSIQPPQAIAAPIRAREVAKQKLAQFQQEKLQQDSEAKLKVQTILVEQKKRMIEAEQQVVEQTTKAMQEQAVTKTVTEQGLSVAKTKLEASKDQASALMAKGRADAEVIRFKNKAEVSGLASRVEAFNGDGAALAQNVLVTKLAPAFRSILSNTDGPIMELFAGLSKPAAAPTAPAKLAARPAPSNEPAPAPSASELPAPPFNGPVAPLPLDNGPKAEESKP